MQAVSCRGPGGPGYFVVLRRALVCFNAVPALFRVAAVYTILRKFRGSAVPHYLGTRISAIPHYPGIVRYSAGSRNSAVTVSRLATHRTIAGPRLL